MGFMPGNVVGATRDIHSARSVHACILEKMTQDFRELHKKPNKLTRSLACAREEPIKHDAALTRFLAITSNCCGS